MHRPHGKVSLGTLVLLTLAAGVIYAAVMIAPFYVDHLDVKEAVSVAHNLAGKNNSDALLRNAIRERTSQLGSHWARDEYDRDVLRPGLGLTDEQISIERSEVTQNIRIQVDYERKVRLKPSSYIYTLRFKAVKEGIPGQL